MTSVLLQGVPASLPKPEKPLNHQKKHDDAWSVVLQRNSVGLRYWRSKRETYQRLEK